MAGIEKVCECSSDNCAYHGGDMWKYKHNHLQINTECRGKYFGKTAKIFYLNPLHLNSDRYYAYSTWGRTSYGSLYKSDDVVYNGKLYNEEQYVMKRKPYKQYYHTMCRISDYNVVQDQKELVEFLTLKLKNTVSLLGE